MRGDLGDDPLDVLHHLREVYLVAHVSESEGFMLLEQLHHLGTGDQRLAWNAAGVEAVAAHAVLLDQRHLGIDHRADEGGHQSSGSGTDGNEVVVVTRHDQRLEAGESVSRRRWMTVTSFFTSNGNTPSSTKEPSRGGERRSPRVSSLPSSNPALT